MIKGGIIAIKSSRNQAFTGIISFSAGSLNNVHEPRNAESLYLCGFPAFVLLDDSSLALFVGRVMIREYVIVCNDWRRLYGYFI